MRLHFVVTAPDTLSCVCNSCPDCVIQKIFLKLILKGACRIDVRCRGVPIQGSPFRYQAFDLKRVSVRNVCKGTLVGSEVTFDGNNIESHLKIT